MTDVLELWREFVASLPLFATSYAVGLLGAALLALVGVFALARRQLFLGVVIAQSSTLGMALALATQSASVIIANESEHGRLLGFGIAFGVAAALITGRGRRPQESAEAIGSWLFVFAAAMSVLLLAHGPHGLEEIERLMFSSLIGADRADLWRLGSLLAIAVLALFAFDRSLLFVATDPTCARALGLPARGMSLSLSLALGIAMGATIHAAGNLFAIANLAMPALTARAVARTMRGTLLLAPIIAVATTFIGFVIANGFDYPLGQVAAATTATAALLAAAWRYVSPRS